MNIGSGKDFRPDCLNLDMNSQWEPGIVHDLNHPLPQGGPPRFQTLRFGAIEIRSGMFEKIIAYDVLEHISNLTVAMKNCLDLLKQVGMR